MSFDNTLSKFTSDLQSFGRPVLNQLFPKEIELYVCAFEIINGDNKTEDYFIFPVNPSMISDRTQFLNNTKRTEGGITTITSPRTVPSPITINGNFGRKFRFLLNGVDGGDLLSTISLSKDTLKNPKQILGDGKKLVEKLWNTRMKTGYGCCKILEDIVNKSREKDAEGRGYTLVFHNLAFNRVSIVKPLSLDFSQDQSTNMIWNYSLTMESLGDKREYFDSGVKSSVLIADKVVQDSIDAVVGKLTKTVNKLKLF